MFYSWSDMSLWCVFSCRIIRVWSVPSLMWSVWIILPIWPLLLTWEEVRDLTAFPNPLFICQFNHYDVCFCQKAMRVNGKSSTFLLRISPNNLRNLSLCSDLPRHQSLLSKDLSMNPYCTIVLLFLVFWMNFYLYNLWFAF